LRLAGLAHVSRPVFFDGKPDFFAILAAVRGGSSILFVIGLVLATAATGSPCYAQAPEDSAEPSRIPNPQLVGLAEEFQAWLAQNQPVSRHAVLRLQRPPEWEPDWSQTSLQRRKVEYLQLQGRLKAINTLGFDTADRVDAATLSAAMDRVHWELEVLSSPRRDPGFYLDQSLGSVFELLIQTPEPRQADIEALILRLKRFPGLINSAKLNLDRVVNVLAEAAIARIGDSEATITELEGALSNFVPASLAGDFEVGMRAARQSLSSYKDWLIVSLDRFQEPPDVGAQRYRWYLGHVAMVPRSPEELLIESEVAFARAGSQLAVFRHRYSEAPAPAGLDRVDRLVTLVQISQNELQAFLDSTEFVSGFAAMPGFGVAAMPPALKPIAGAGEPIQFGAGEGFATVRYLSAQGDTTALIERLAWVDPRLLITWDGVPGRHAQFLEASRNPDPIRQHAISASPGEGLALYFHEQVMGAGLYALSPVSLELGMQLLQYRAALAHADDRLANGNWDLEKTVDYLAGTAGLTRPQALHAAESLVVSPGLAGAAFAAYGQAVRYLADAAAIKEESFSLPEFNDRLLRNANVPIALQRWEYLGLEDELDQLIEQRGRPATVPE